MCVNLSYNVLFQSKVQQWFEQKYLHNFTICSSINFCLMICEWNGGCHFLFTFNTRLYPLITNTITNVHTLMLSIFYYKEILQQGQLSLFFWKYVISVAILLSSVAPLSTIVFLLRLGFTYSTFTFSFLYMYHISMVWYGTLSKLIVNAL